MKTFGIVSMDLTTFFLSVLQLRGAKIPESEFKTLPNGLKLVNQPKFFLLLLVYFLHYLLLCYNMDTFDSFLNC